MKDSRFVILYLILTVAQILLCNFFGLSRYVLISVLPVMVMMLPLSLGTVAAMLVAFATGFAVDFFSTGMLGITPLALVPVALVRKPFVSMVFSDSQNFRGEDVTLGRLGIPKMTLAVAMVCSLYFIIYIWADSAGTAGFWPAMLRLVLSVVVSTFVGILAARLLRAG